MTTVLVLARLLRRLSPRSRVEGILLWAVLVGLASCREATAQDRPVHWLNAGALPPGAIGSLRLERGGPVSGYFQPVRIRAPQGARIALAMENGFSDTQSNDSLVGFQIGTVYRLKVSAIPNLDVEIFPTVEIIDRLYPPPGLAIRFPIPVELTQDELELAAGGAFVTRVVYVEDPQQALPVKRRPGQEQPWLEAPAGEDPLVTADRNGRPVAILRIGSRVPKETTKPGMNGAVPRFVVFDPSATCAGAATKPK